ncbi:MAG: WGR domain-containing protein [Dokdonella sp.]
MRLFMQNKPAESETPRYYQIDLTQDLLGGWTLYREWSQNGGRISSKREVYLERDVALSAFEGARDSQLRKGFLVMFSRGLDGPR